MRSSKLCKTKPSKQLENPMLNFRKSSEVKESNFMAPKVAAEHDPTHKFSQMTLLVISCLVISFLIWASFAAIDVVTRGSGRVIPFQKTQVISNLEGGIIKEVLVKEGQVVQAGQVLMRLEPKIAEAHFKARREEYLRYLAAASRLEAQLKGKDYHVPEEVEKELPAVGAEEVTHYHERKEQLTTQQSISTQVMLEKKQEVAETKAKVAQAQEQLDLSEQELKMVAPLVNEQLISKREILRLQRDAANLKGEVATGKASLPKAQAALEQAQFEVKQVPIKFQNEDQEQLRDIKVKLAEAQSLMLEAQDRMTRTEIRSPIKAIVKEIKLKTMGGVIRGGDEVITLVPYADTLLIEALISPSDVAFVHVGQKATIKVMAYDYSIYGSLKGRVVEISADTVHDPEQKKDFYRVLVHAHQNYLVYQSRKLPIIPGMNVEVDILTGTRTVMQYLLKPLIRGATSSLTER
jgi:adhesin transport system membrane fusion protein